MNSQLLKASSGSKFFYANTGTTYGIFTCCAKMTEPVDADILHSAVQLAMSRYPYLRVRPRIIDGAYYLERNDLPVVVNDAGQHVAFGEAESNYHLLAFSCKGRDIMLHLDHALVDGTGSTDPFYSALYYYCKIKYNRDFDCPNVKKADAAPAPDEYASPYERDYPDPKAPLVNERKPWFALPETGGLGANSRYVSTFSVREADLMPHVKSSDNSPASLMALLLLRSVEAVHPDHKENLACVMPANYRNAIAMPRTHQNAFVRPPVVYTERARDLSFDNLSAIIRGQIILQTEKRQMLRQMQVEQSHWREAMTLATIEEKREFYRTRGARRSAYPICTYVGKWNFGEIEQYIENAYVLHSGYDGILLELTAASGRFGFAFAFGFDGKQYFNAYLKQLEELGVPYEIGETYDFQLRPKSY